MGVEGFAPLVLDFNGGLPCLLYQRQLHHCLALLNAIKCDPVAGFKVDIGHRLIG